MFKLLLKRPSLSLTSWLLLVSVYISVCLNVAFYNQVMRVLPLDSTRNVLVFISMPFVAFSVINIVLTLASFLCCTACWLVCLFWLQHQHNISS